MSLPRCLNCFPAYTKEAPVPTWELLPQGGVTAFIPEQAGLSEFHLHFNINNPLGGVAAGEYNVMVT